MNPVSLPPDPSISGLDASMLLVSLEKATHPFALNADGASQTTVGLAAAVSFVEGSEGHSARPGQQFTLRREVYARACDAFRDANISFAKAPLAMDGPTPGEDER